MDLLEGIARLKSELASMASQRDAELRALDLDREKEISEHSRELLVLQDAIDDAKCRHRSRVVEGLSRRFEEQLAVLVKTNQRFESLKQQCRQRYLALSSEPSLLLNRLEYQLDTNRVIVRNKELQERRYRKIPVLK
jgi:hypothetical protein